MAERTLHFNSLPPAVRERLAQVFAGRDPCVPYAVRPMEPPGVMIVWLIIAGGALWWLFFRVKPIGLPRWPDILWMTLAAFVAAWALLGFGRRQRLRAALPYPPGHYLFAMEVIDATSDLLRVRAMGESTGLQLTHHLVNGRYSYTDMTVKFPSGDFHFPIAGKEKAESLHVRFQLDRARLQQAARLQEMDTILRLDPLFAIRQGNLWAQAARPPDSTPGPSPSCRTSELPRRDDLLWKSAAVACLAGPLLAASNSLLFDQVQFRETRERHNSGAYREYLQDGWLHHREVQEELLPQTLFENAKSAGSVRGLRDYLREFPSHRSAAEARAEIHQLYVRALAKLRSRASPQASDFLEALLGWLEKNESPTVVVSFARPGSEALAAVDRVLGAKSGDVPGVAVAPASPSFTAQACESREAGIVHSLNAGFREVVPQYILNLEPSPRLTRPAEVQSVPTLAVAYTIAPSGSRYLDSGNSRAFVGIQVTFSLALSSPGATPLKFTVDVLPPDRFTVPYTKRSADDSRGPGDDTVYDVMATRAFEQLKAKLTEVFFRNPVKTAELTTPSSGR